MYLWSVFLMTVLLTCVFSDSPQFLSVTKDNVTSTGCPVFPIIPNANVKIIQGGTTIKFAVVTCEEGYEIIGSSEIICSDAQWVYDKLPKCEQIGCHPPPYFENGALEFDEQIKESGIFKEGTWATYSCASGYSLEPPTARYKVCKRGAWAGIPAVCKFDSSDCPPLQSIDNGYLVYGKAYIPGCDEFKQTVRVFCNSGYVLRGPKVLECVSNGRWNSEIIPKCQNNYEMFEDATCDTLPTVPHSSSELVEQENVEEAVVEIRCLGEYRNLLAPCQNIRLRCKEGRWIGALPTCVLTDKCLPPPLVPYAIIVNLNSESEYESSRSSKFPIGSKIVYQCTTGYVLEGNPVLTCSSNGCWQPAVPPICIKINFTHTRKINSIEIDNINAILISTATGAGVLGILLLICLVVACRKRKAHLRAISSPPPLPRQDLNDHTVLLQHPDRLALIAFAEGVQSGENSLPTYDEAVRNERGGGGPGLAVNRLHRPQWPNLGGRRARNSPNPDYVHVARHGSFVSHTPSTRSAGDSMGSTDTMAVSEGSTNITLDTVSSISGSQNASCRAHCGSLASFDGCSIINNEDVPLIEESELEEIQGGNNDVENPIISENLSSKISTNSAPILTT